MNEQERAALLAVMDTVALLVMGNFPEMAADLKVKKAAVEEAAAKAAAEKAAPAEKSEPAVQAEAPEQAPAPRLVPGLGIEGDEALHDMRDPRPVVMAADGLQCRFIRRLNAHFQLNASLRGLGQ